MSPELTRVRCSVAMHVRLPMLLLLLLQVTPFASTGAVRTGLPRTRIALVHAVFRHGARTPVDTFPTDPYFNHSLAPVGWGQLTNEGKLAQFRQGEWLRRRYDSLLGDLYFSDLLYARSTDAPRALMSAQLELAGIWPPAPDQQWHPSLRWQPIPVHTVPLHQENLLLGQKSCPKFYQLRDQVLGSEAVQRKLQSLNVSELYSHLSNVTGLTVDDPDDVQSIYSTLKAEEEFGLPIADWIREFYPQKLEEITALSFEYNVYTKEMKKIKGGLLLKEIYENTKNKINETLAMRHRRFYMYSGHDSTVVNLLMALGVWDTQIPNYGILALVELHQEEETQEYGIKIYLRNSTDHDPYPLTIPGCAFFCPFSDFESLIDDLIKDDVKEICQVDDPNYVTPASTSI